MICPVFHKKRSANPKSYSDCIYCNNIYHFKLCSITRYANLDKRKQEKIRVYSFNSKQCCRSQYPPSQKYIVSPNTSPPSSHTYCSKLEWLPYFQASSLLPSWRSTRCLEVRGWEKITASNGSRSWATFSHVEPNPAFIYTNATPLPSVCLAAIYWS